MKRMLNGEEPVEMQPWYRGFSGAIMEVPSKTAGKSYTLNGVVSQVRTYMQLHNVCQAIWLTFMSCFQACTSVQSAGGMTTCAWCSTECNR